eukprot:2668683-Rhodomonas_salina.2
MQTSHCIRERAPLLVLVQCRPAKGGGLQPVIHDGASRIPLTVPRVTHALPRPALLATLLIFDAEAASQQGWNKPSPAS